MIKAVEEGQRTRSLLIPGVMGLVTLYLGVNMLPLIGELLWSVVGPFSSLAARSDTERQRAPVRM